MITPDPVDRREERFWTAIRFAQVRAVKRDRACRAKYLPWELFAEPAWDILLELYSFELVGRFASEAQLIEKLAVPATVSIRWMKMLEVQNLISRFVDPEDSAAVQIQLTAQGLAAMDAYFSDRDKSLDARISNL